MGTDTNAIWVDDTLDGLMDFREHDREVSPGFGMVYQADGEWCWMMIYGPEWFRKAMHPQRNPDGLGVAHVFYDATRHLDLQGLRDIGSEGIIPAGWLFCASGYSARMPGGGLSHRPREHENRRRVYMSSYLDQQTGELTSHLNYYPDELQVFTESMPAGGWQASKTMSTAITMDRFRLASLAPASSDDGITMKDYTDLPEGFLGSIPLTASGGVVRCDLPAADGTACPSTITAVGSPAQARAQAAASGWRTVEHEGDALDVCPNHPDRQ